MGLVDATKAFRGGPSNIGFGDVETAIAPFLAASAPGTGTAFGTAEILRTLRANWLNGMPKPDQKAKAKSLIHLGLTQGNAAALAAAAGVDPAKLTNLAAKTTSGTTPDPDEINVLGQFDAVLSAVLDAAYERGDQRYRNASKLLAMAVSTILGAVGGWLVYSGSTTASAWSYFGSWHFGVALLVGLSATPLAPIAKDLATSLQASVGTIRMVRR
jgi:hypothetical protein